MLADNGFDVWIVSSRGTIYSRGHVSLKPEDEVSFDLFYGFELFISYWASYVDGLLLNCQLQLIVGLLGLDMG